MSFYKRGYRPFFKLQLKRIVGNRSGNFGVLSALLMSALFGAVGIAVDLGAALDAKNMMQIAADSAVLDAVSPAALRLLQQGASVTGQLENQAIGMFRGQINAAMISNLGIRAQVKISEKESGYSADMVFSARLPTRFLRLIGQPYIDLVGSSTASAAPTTFLDLHMLIDNSSSMAVPTTYSEIDRLKMTLALASKTDRTIIDRNGCAYACHDVSDPASDRHNYYDYAVKAGITLRIDAARQGAITIAETAMATRTNPGQYRLALYSLGEQMAQLYNNPLPVVSPLSIDLQQFEMNASGLELIKVTQTDDQNAAGTYLPAVLEQLTKIIPASGTGQSAAGRRQVLLIVSDGLADSYKLDRCDYGANYGRCFEPIDVSLCDKLKSRGVTVAVVHTPYLPQQNSGFYSYFIAPIEKTMDDAMERCATPGFYRRVDFGGNISSTMSELFQAIQEPVRLTN